MLDYFPVSAIVGVILGFLAGLGIGGGSLLILWLTLVLQMPHDSARGINLLFFIPAAIIACIMRRRQGYIQLQTVLPAAIAGCTATVFFTFISTSIDTAILKKPFGVLLIATGLKELFYRPRKAR